MLCLRDSNETVTTVNVDVALITRQRNGYILTSSLAELHRPAGINILLGCLARCYKPDIFGSVLHTVCFSSSNAPGIPGASGVASPSSRPKKHNQFGRSRIRNSICSSLTFCCAASLEHQHRGGRPPCEPLEYCKPASITEYLRVNTGRSYLQRITRRK